MRLRDLREDSDMTQQSLAEYLNISQSALSQYENEQRQLPYNLLIKLAIYFDTSTDYLLGLTNDRRPYPRSSDIKPKPTPRDTKRA